MCLGRGADLVGGNDELGRLELDVSTILEEGWKRNVVEQFEFELPGKDDGDDDTAVWQKSDYGKVELGLWFVPMSAFKPPCSGLVVVSLRRAEGLLVADINGFSDPYVTFTLAETVHKSRTIQKTLAPRWHGDEFRFSVNDAATLDELRLSVIVKDHDKLGFDDVLGSVAIDLGPALGTDWAQYSGKSKWHVLGDNEGKVSSDALAKVATPGGTGARWHKVAQG